MPTDLRTHARAVAVFAFAGIAILGACTALYAGAVHVATALVPSSDETPVLAAETVTLLGFTVALAGTVGFLCFLFVRVPETREIPAADSLLGLPRRLLRTSRVWMTSGRPDPGQEPSPRTG